MSPGASDVAYFTVTVFPLAGDSVTLKVMLSPSVALAPATLSAGAASLSTIVPCADAAVVVALSPR